MYIGFYTIAGYDSYVVAKTERECRSAMRRDFFEWRAAQEGVQWHEWMQSFRRAEDYFGWRVEEVELGVLTGH